MNIRTLIIDDHVGVGVGSLPDCIVRKCRTQSITKKFTVLGNSQIPQAGFNLKQQPGMKKEDFQHGYNFDEAFPEHA